MSITKLTKEQIKKLKTDKQKLTGSHKPVQK